MKKISTKRQPRKPGPFIDHSKPMIEMTPGELKAAFAEIGLRGNFEMLQDARRGRNQQIIIAAAVLRCPDGNSCFSYFANEYGDRDGIGMVEKFIEECQSYPGLLLPGETLKLELLQVTEWRAA